jgi:hypothetical protein
LLETGWRNDAGEGLKKRVEKFHEDEEIRKLLREVENDTDDPDGEKRPFSV